MSRMSSTNAMCRTRTRAQRHDFARGALIYEPSCGAPPCPGSSRLRCACKSRSTVGSTVGACSTGMPSAMRCTQRRKASAPGSALFLRECRFVPPGECSMLPTSGNGRWLERYESMPQATYTSRLGASHSRPCLGRPSGPSLCRFRPTHSTVPQRRWTRH